MKPFLLALLLSVCACTGASTDDAPGAGEDDFTARAALPMTRVLACAGPDANMELYLPEGPLGTTPVIGAYALDLTAANKGKALEAVRVSRGADGASIVVAPYTRKLPPTTIPIAGGIVDFDQRFATGARCPAFDSSLVPLR